MMVDSIHAIRPTSFCKSAVRFSGCPELHPGYTAKLRLQQINRVFQEDRISLVFDGLDCQNAIRKTRSNSKDCTGACILTGVRDADDSGIPQTTLFQTSLAVGLRVRPNIKVARVNVSCLNKRIIASV
jgi:hypothetical protein